MFTVPAVLTVLLAVVVGLSLGLLGGGGSILMVPLLVYVAGMDPKEAIAASLVVVGVTAAMSVVGHARAGRVRWRTGLIFGAAGMAGAFAGGLLGGLLPGALLLAGFAVMMVVTAVAMLRGRTDLDPARAHTELPIARVLLDGGVVGLVTGLVGAGGGFLVVPALALLGGLPMGVAVGTSLLVIAMKSFAGLAGYLTSVTLDWRSSPPSRWPPCWGAWSGAGSSAGSRARRCSRPSAGSCSRWARSCWCSRPRKPSGSRRSPSSPSSARRSRAARRGCAAARCADAPQRLGVRDPQVSPGSPGPGSCRAVTLAQAPWRVGVDAAFRWVPSDGISVRSWRVRVRDSVAGWVRGRSRCRWSYRSC